MTANKLFVQNIALLTKYFSASDRRPIPHDATLCPPPPPRRHASGEALSTGRERATYCDGAPVPAEPACHSDSYIESLADPYLYFDGDDNIMLSMLASHFVSGAITRVLAFAPADYEHLLENNLEPTPPYGLSIPARAY